LKKIVLSVVGSLGEELEIENLKDPILTTKLFSKNLDSMGVVLLVAELEDEIAEEYDLDIAIADERAMSQKTSPFKSIVTLIKYLELLIDEQNSS
jgi:acyl carrier protein